MSKAPASSAGAKIGGEPSVTASAIVDRTVGSHILRIDCYTHSKVLGNGKCFTSETFTVGGHRWCLQYYPNGADYKYRDWVSFSLRLDHTDVDEVKAKFTVSLLDEDGNPVSLFSSSSAVSTFSVRRGVNAECLIPDFMRRRDLEMRYGYMTDDTFSVKCDVTVAAKEIFTKAIPVPAVRRRV